LLDYRQRLGLFLVGLAAMLRMVLDPPYQLCKQPDRPGTYYTSARNPLKWLVLYQGFHGASERPMTVEPSPSTIGLLLSGGLDSSILLGHLLRDGRRVQPFYVRCGLRWETSERRQVDQFLHALAGPRLAELVVLDLPLADLYGDHWSLSGRGVPGLASPDTAVYLPGRNALLLVKAALWCRLHGIEELALAVLAANPFADATPEFFAAFEALLRRGTGGRVRISRPFGRLAKREVMELGRGLPLELTFSCIAPRDGLHCGQCNKCAERMAAFAAIGADDPTPYATRLKGDSPIFAGTIAARCRPPRKSGQSP
jgi:7-cyano-7-deazaguanine synthase